MFPPIQRLHLHQLHLYHSNSNLPLFPSRSLYISNHPHNRQKSGTHTGVTSELVTLVGPRRTCKWPDMYATLTTQEEDEFLQPAARSPENRSHRKHSEKAIRTLRRLFLSFG
ncbi:hypothetical protein Hdeb2414_s0018g00525661 [Helianthus debilis subsp. tardiflorus]